MKICNFWLEENGLPCEQGLDNIKYECKGIFLDKYESKRF